jgi:hypothetical protein
MMKKSIFSYMRIRKTSENNIKTQREHCSTYEKCAMFFTTISRAKNIIRKTAS